MMKHTVWTVLMMLSAFLLFACTGGEKLEFKVKARMDGQPTAQAKVTVDNEEQGFIGICLFLIPYLLGGMGAGDAKLMGAAGALLGAKGVILAALLAIVFGGIYAMVLLMIHHEYTRSLLRRLESL